MLRIVDNSAESQRRAAIKDLGLAIRELSACVMCLSAQSGDALDFRIAFSQAAEKLEAWPGGQPYPSSDELRQELCFSEGQQPSFQLESADETSENLNKVSAGALEYVAAVFRGISPQIWAQKRTMLEACAELIRTQANSSVSSDVNYDVQRHQSLSQPMRSALDYFLSDNPIRRSTKRPPKRSTIRALIRRKMLHQTGSGLLDYRTNTAGRIEFINAPA